MPRKQAATAPASGPVAAATAPAEKSAKTVTVACKLPHGMRLRLFKMVDGVENVSGNNTRTVQRAIQVGEDVVVRGNAVAVGKEKPLVGGYALTPNVSKEFFDEWMRQNQHHDAVKNGLIFAATTRDGVEGQAEDGAKLKSGLEPLDMSMVKRGERMVAADPRMPRPLNPNLGGIEKSDEKADAAA